MKTFDEYFKKYWNGLTFWGKVRYRIIDLWGWIEVYFQVYTHKLFGIDWSDKSTDEWDAPLVSDYLGSESDPSI